MAKTAAAIEQELLRHLASIGQGQDPTLYYGQFAALPAINDRFNLSGSKRQLDLIRKNYGRKRDITIVLKNNRTHYPSQIDGADTRERTSLTPARKQAAHDILEDVIKQFCPGATNPY